MPHDFHLDTMSPDPAAGALFEDVEVRCRTDVAAVRGNAGRTTQTTVEVRAADIVDRGAVLAELSTTELRGQGVGGLASRPVMVGSVFHLSFPADDFDVRATLAVCDRCAMLGDASFELHFRFVQTLVRQGERRNQGA